MKKLMLTALLALGGIAATVSAADAANVVRKRDRYELPVYVVASSRTGPVTKSCLPPCSAATTYLPPAKVVIRYHGSNGRYWHQR